MTLPAFAAASRWHGLAHAFGEIVVVVVLTLTLRYNAVRDTLQDRLQ